MATIIERLDAGEDPLRLSIDVAEQLTASGREKEACAYLLDDVLPLVQERADAMRKAVAS